MLPALQPLLERYLSYIKDPDSPACRSHFVARFRRRSTFWTKPWKVLPYTGEHLQAVAGPSLVSLLTDSYRNQSPRLPGSRRRVYNTNIAVTKDSGGELLGVKFQPQLSSWKRNQLNCMGVLSWWRVWWVSDGWFLPGSFIAQKIMRFKKFYRDWDSLF